MSKVECPRTITVDPPCTPRLTLAEEQPNTNRERMLCCLAGTALVDIDQTGFHFFNFETPSLRKTMRRALDSLVISSAVRHRVGLILFDPGVGPDFIGNKTHKHTKFAQIKAKKLMRTTQGITETVPTNTDQICARYIGGGLSFHLFETTDGHGDIYLTLTANSSQKLFGDGNVSVVSFRLNDMNDSQLRQLSSLLEHNTTSIILSIAFQQLRIHEVEFPSQLAPFISQDEYFAMDPSDRIEYEEYAQLMLKRVGDIMSILAYTQEPNYPLLLGAQRWLNKLKASISDKAIGHSEFGLRLYHRYSEHLESCGGSTEQQAKNGAYAQFLARVINSAIMSGVLDASPSQLESLVTSGKDLTEFGEYFYLMLWFIKDNHSQIAGFTDNGNRERKFSILDSSYLLPRLSKVYEALKSEKLDQNQWLAISKLFFIMSLFNENDEIPARHQKEMCAILSDWVGVELTPFMMLDE